LKVSVIIATYHWPGALRLAIQSALNQSYADFEVLVIGDGCTDETEATVLSFRDKRIRRDNLEKNHGSQSAPNNRGLSLARGDLIAYLGHDDIWHPDHLANAVALHKKQGWDVVAGAMILYGPPCSGIMGLAGIFPGKRYTPRQFIPPSALIHRKELTAKAGLWRAPKELKVPVDVDFLRRIHRTGFSIGTTGQLTVFKYNAGWRKNSYRKRDTSEQEVALAAMLGPVKEREIYLQKQMLAVIQAAADGRLLGTENPSAGENAPKGHHALFNRRVKGLEPKSAAYFISNLKKPMRLKNACSEIPFEWHPQNKKDQRHLKARWSGPSSVASLDLPVIIDAECAVKILIAAAIRPDALDQLKIKIGQAEKIFQRRKSSRGEELLLELSPIDFKGQTENISIELIIPETHRPYDLELSNDRRWLGLGVAWVEIIPKNRKSVRNWSDFLNKWKK